MLKLSIKDIRIYWFAFLINLVFWTVIAPAALQNPDIYLMLPIGFSLLIIMIPLGNDMRDGRDILYASLPISRYKIVIARYLSSFLLTVIAFVWLILLGLLMERYLPDLAGDLSGTLSFDIILIPLLIISLILSIYLPIVFRFGFGAVISGGIAIIAIVISGFWTAASYLITINDTLPGIRLQEGTGMFNILSENNLFSYLNTIIRHYGRGLIITLIFLVMIAALAISISISIKIFSRKEL
jgi:ABC-type transport system involved in multi-copper enzyme maturation permease subunit